MIDSLDQFIHLVEGDAEIGWDRIRVDEISETTLCEIIQKRPDFCRIITLRKNLPEPIIRVLARSEDPSVRTDIAMRRNVPSDVRETLAGDDDESVRARVAHNKKTPIDLLEILVKDRSRIVAEPAARRLHELNQ